MCETLRLQFDTYRSMRQLTGGDWSASCPATNCLWMAYLAEVLAASKIGTGTGAAAHKRKLREFRCGGRDRGRGCRVRGRGRGCRGRGCRGRGRGRGCRVRCGMMLAWRGALRTLPRCQSDV